MTEHATVMVLIAVDNLGILNKHICNKYIVSQKVPSKVALLTVTKLRMQGIKFD